MKHEHKIYLSYLLELLGGFALYAVVLVVSIDVGRPMRTGIGRTLIEVSLMIPFLLVVWVIVRYLRRLDEYQRLQTLENIAIAAAITAGWTFTYGFLENAGFPQISMFNVMPVMFWTWAILFIVRNVIRR
jgi:hypothetical protein